MGQQVMDNDEVLVAKVRLVDGRSILLPISGKDKPAVSSEVIAKWQNTVNLVADILDVPTGLITNIDSESLSIRVASAKDGNPFKAGDSLPLGIGMYCETTTGTQGLVQVPDALDDEQWKDNPSVDFNMISYIGMPIMWPDGEIFGTFCMLDSRGHKHADTHKQLLTHFRSVIETDLAMLMEREELRRLNLEKDFTLREAHHRIKNHLNMIMSIIQLRSDESTVSPEAMQHFLRDITARVGTIAKLHSQLAYARDCDIDLGTYVRDISEAILDSVAERDVKLHFDLEPVLVCREIFLDVGLLLSELITNSLKHAFADMDAPEITIAVHADGERAFSLEYRDNGSGLPPDYDPDDESNIGSMLIQNLPVRMGGTHEITSDNGFVFRARLKKQSPMKG